MDNLLTLDQCDRLVTLVYEAGFDKRRWTNFVDELGVLSGEKESSPMLRLLGFLGPHLYRSFELAGKLAASRADPSTQLLLEAIPEPAVLLDHSGSIVVGNARADALRHSGLVRIRAGRPVFTQPAAGRAFADVIRQVARGEGDIVDATFPLGTTRAGTFSWEATILPCSRPSIASAGTRILADGVPVALLRVTATETRAGRIAALRDAFGLTEAEAILALAIAKGQPLRAFADERGISHNTARNQLRAIFDKVGVRRQAELVALLGASLPARARITDVT